MRSGLELKRVWIEGPLAPPMITSLVNLKKRLLRHRLMFLIHLENFGDLLVERSLLVSASLLLVVCCFAVAFRCNTFRLYQ